MIKYFLLGVGAAIAIIVLMAVSYVAGSTKNTVDVSSRVITIPDSKTIAPRPLPLPRDIQATPVNPEESLPRRIKNYQVGSYYVTPLWDGRVIHFSYCRSVSNNCWECNNPIPYTGKFCHRGDQIMFAEVRRR